MNVGTQNTSLISILSTTHGRLRREQRDIDKRDLQRALRYGTKQRAWGNRWLIAYDGITFITDDTMRIEITAYPSPLPLMPIDNDMKSQHEKARHLLLQKPELATSHTVFIIDNSGSMLDKKNDFHLYRDSQNAAFSMTALEFVAEQLFQNTAVNSDLVSLIKFDKTVEVPFEREPVGWVVYNKFLEHRNTQKYRERLNSPLVDKTTGGTNYIPALAKAKDLLEAGYHNQCALSLFFFSDGEPTDHVTLRIPYSEAQKRMCTLLSQMATRFGGALNVTIVGLGTIKDDFSCMRAMANAANKAGAKGTFQFCNKTANAISSAISSLVSSTTESRTAFMEGRRTSLTVRTDLKSEKDSVVKYDWQYLLIHGHYYYDAKRKCFKQTLLMPIAAIQTDPAEAARRKYHPPPYLAINRNYFGKGAERVAFRCRLSDDRASNYFVFDAMIAKETKDVERKEEKIGFHRTFMETQELASYLATKFNKQLVALPGYHAKKTPQITFLTCSVLEVHDSSWPSGYRGILVEKLLDTQRFTWTKWNDNNGMVEGKYRHAALDVDFELKQLEREKKANHLAAIVEEDEDDDEDDSSDDSSTSDDSSNDDSSDNSSTSDDSSNDGSPQRRATNDINPYDYLQAFTHFTYRYTHKKVMVCDLQGVFNTDMTPPTFELTDPAIHYSSTNGRGMVFGRTDKGRSGMQSFFRTHKCTKICKYLELSAKNKKWRSDWHSDNWRRHERLSVRNEHRHAMQSFQNEYCYESTSLRNNEHRYESTSLRNERRHESTSLRNERHYESTSLRNERRHESTSLRNEHRYESTSRRNEHRYEEQSLPNEYAISSSAPRESCLVS